MKIETSESLAAESKPSFIISFLFVCLVKFSAAFCELENDFINRFQFDDDCGEVEESSEPMRTMELGRSLRSI